ncbi:MAG: ImmA/IrrE family metallo-endopeptidase [Symploca sp. SIO1A3]|nr:ImmA/IrrE family metallo-endopeptidase [Symploca sp. SIO1A3]
MTQTPVKMDSLYERLKDIGFPKQFIRQQALPDWWDEELETNSSAVVEAAAYISRRLNLDILSLLKPEKSLSFKSSCQAKFKTIQGTQSEKLVVAKCMAARIAEMVAYTFKNELKLLPNTAQAVRNEILVSQKFVNLEGLLNWCSDYGIPVVHFNGFPKNKRIHKFHGMVAYVYSHPVIVISLNQPFDAWLLFILAHELGHLIKGHVNAGTIIDEEVLPESVDNEEIEANEFAVELLFGKPDMTYYTPRFLNGEELADYAWNVSKRDNVDPGVVVLNYTWSKANLVSSKNKKPIWTTAIKALKLIKSDGNAPLTINQHLRENLDLERLDEDSQEYLELTIGG